MGGKDSSNLQNRARLLLCLPHGCPSTQVTLHGLHIVCEDGSLLSLLRFIKGAVILLVTSLWGTHGVQQDAAMFGGQMSLALAQQLQRHQCLMLQQHPGLSQRQLLQTTTIAMGHMCFALAAQQGRVQLL